MNWIDNMRGLDVDSPGGLAVGCVICVVVIVFACLGAYGG